jgi:hypothetical protein
MTRTLTPPGATPTDRGPRKLVMADLLPTEIVLSRLARKVRRAVVTVLTAFAVVLVIWGGIATYQTHQARSDLDAAQTQADGLRARQQTYREVTKVQAQSAAIDARLGTLMALDLQWAGLLAAVQQQAPHGVQLTAISGVIPYGPDAAQDATVVKLPNTTGQKVVGTLTISGTAPNQALIASYVDAVAKLSGLGNPLVQSFALAEGVYGWTAELDITDSMLGGRYTSKSGEN